MTLRRIRRLRSFRYVGRYAYFLTFCSDHRKEVFTSDERVECARSEILRTCMERHFAVPAGVFMPDHLHLLLRGLDNDSSLKDCTKVVRQRSSRAFKSAFEERLWQEGYFDHIVRDADNEREVIRYIVENPVRAGLCKGAEDYRYSWWPGHEMGLADVRGAEL